MKILNKIILLTALFSLFTVAMPTGTALAGGECRFSCDRVLKQDRPFKDFSKNSFQNQDTVFFEPIEFFPIEPIVFDTQTRIRIFNTLRPTNVDFIFAGGSPIPVAFRPNYGIFNLDELGNQLFPRINQNQGVFFTEPKSRFLGSDVIFW